MMADQDWQEDPRVKAAAFEGLSHNRAMSLAERLGSAQQAIELLRTVIEKLEEEIEADHVFDETSVLNPVTGKPYGPGPLWAGTEPMDYPDPLCTCGAPWQEDGTEKGHCGRNDPVWQAAIAEDKGTD